MAEIYKAPSGREYVVQGRNPNLYPRIPGPNYRGELQGMIYDPWNDRYIPNPKEQQQYLEGIGAADPTPKPMTPFETAGWTVGTGAAGGLVYWGADRFADKMGWGSGSTPTTTAPSTPQGIQINRVPSSGGGGGLLNVGGSTPVSTVQSSGNITPVGSAKGGGLLMSDGSVQAAPQTPTGVQVTRLDANGNPVQTGPTTGQYVQGGLGAVQGYQGYQQWQQGDKFGGGVNMAAGAGNIAAAAGSQTAASYVPGLNLVAGAYGMSQTLKGTVRTRNAGSVGAKTAQGASAGAAIGAGIGASFFGVGAAPGAVIGAIVGGVAGLVRGLWKSGRHEDFYRRDAYRHGLEQMGLADRSGGKGRHALIFSDGTKIDINDLRDEGGVQNYELTEEQMKDPIYAFTQAALMPLTNAMGGKDGNIGAEGQTAALLTKGIIKSGHDPATEIRNAYAKAVGIDPAQVNAKEINDWIGQNYEEWGLTKEMAQGYQNGINYWLDPQYDREFSNQTFVAAANKYFEDNPLDKDKD